MDLRLRPLVSAVLAGLLFPACIVFRVGGGDEPTNATPQSQPAASPSYGGGSFDARGSGRVKVEQRAVAGFDRVRVSGAADLFIEQAGEESLSIEAEDNLLPLLTSDVAGGRLSLGVRPNSTISATRPIIFRLKVKSLKEVEASGAGRIEASEFDLPDLKVTISGSVDSTFAGRAGVQEVTISGTGSFDGRALEGTRASVDVKGTGQAVLNVTDELDAEVSGTGAVRYLGEPKIDQRVSGLGRVERLQ